MIPEIILTIGLLGGGLWGLFVIIDVIKNGKRYYPPWR